MIPGRDTIGFQNHNLNTLGRNQLDDATCGLSKLYASLFQTRICIIFSIIETYVKHVITIVGPMLISGLSIEQKW